MEAEREYACRGGSWKTPAERLRLGRVPTRRKILSVRFPHLLFYRSAKNPGQLIAAIKQKPLAHLAILLAFRFRSYQGTDSAEAKDSKTSWLWDVRTS